MDLTSQSAVVYDGNGGAAVKRKEKEREPAYVSMVDPFLVEALQNPRHRLTILRMELDIQKFLKNSDIQQFEFPHLPTSYLRLAAHRVAQHYGVQTLVQDNAVDGQGSRILVIKKPESKFPTVCLSDVPAKESENDKLDQIKIVIRLRPKASSSEANELGLKRTSVRSVEERKEEYDRARARIFSSPSSSESEDASAQAAFDGRNLNVDDNEVLRNFGMDGDKSPSKEVGTSSRVAIFRDREKDRTDPDYDRSYDRYVKSIPHAQNLNRAHLNMQKVQPPFVHYDSFFPQLGQMPAPPASFSYSSPVMSPYCAMGLNQTSRDGLFMQWQTPSIMHAHSYDQLRHAVFQLANMEDANPQPDLSCGRRTMMPMNSWYSFYDIIVCTSNMSRINEEYSGCATMLDSARSFVDGVGGNRPPVKSRAGGGVVMYAVPTYLYIQPGHMKS
ncbi:UNVERIFIED_CONTAM: R3H domain-containing protein 1 [Sesamum latifolium]|uniref:R3H domain-containing protein 1 n=1 Tax=Sesamum latifolium TaxID=2727402 RepID=A0AAW2VJC1_9LAMI